jgi:flagellar capping protein FliD
MSNYLDTASESISSNEDSIGGMEKQIEKLKVKLDALADKYYRKFAAMETALSTLNSQSYYLSQLFMN